MLTHTPNGLKEILATFGNPNAPNFERDNIVKFNLPYPLLYDNKPYTTARCHKLIVENFTAVFEAVKAAGLQAELTHYSGIYNYRKVRQGENLSTHAWGISIDAEAVRYPLNSAKRFPDSIVEIFTRYGFFYGGDFNGRKDPMHFQFCKGY